MYNTDPQQFVYVSKVEKQNNTGIGKNQRILAIKAGLLYYFSSVPKNFNNTLQMLQQKGQLPKFTIQIKKIVKVQLLHSKHKKGQIQIYFYMKDLINKDDLISFTYQNKRQSVFIVANKNNKQNQIVKWKFQLFSIQQANKWVGIIAQLKQYYINKYGNLDTSSIGIKKLIQSTKTDEQKWNRLTFANNNINNQIKSQQRINKINQQLQYKRQIAKLKQQSQILEDEIMKSTKSGDTQQEEQIKLLKEQKKKKQQQLIKIKDQYQMKMQQNNKQRNRNQMIRQKSLQNQKKKKNNKNLIQQTKTSQFTLNSQQFVSIQQIQQQNIQMHKNINQKKQELLYQKQKLRIEFQQTQKKFKQEIQKQKLRLLKELQQQKLVIRQSFNKKLQKEKKQIQQYKIQLEKEFNELKQNFFKQYKNMKSQLQLKFQELNNKQKIETIKKEQQLQKIHSNKNNLHQLQMIKIQCQDNQLIQQYKKLSQNGELDQTYQNCKSQEKSNQKNKQQNMFATQERYSMQQLQNQEFQKQSKKTLKSLVKCMNKQNKKQIIINYKQHDFCQEKTVNDFSLEEFYQQNKKKNQVNAQNFIKLIESLNNSSISQRILIQKEIKSLYIQFKKRSFEYFEQFLKQKTNEQFFKKIIIRDDIHFEIGYVKTEKIILNGEYKKVYDKSEFIILRNKFQFYKQLTQKMIKSILQGDIISYRLPLLCLFQYRGILCLAIKIPNHAKIITNPLYIKLPFEFITYKIFNSKPIIKITHDSLKIKPFTKMDLNFNILGDCPTPSAIDKWVSLYYQLIQDVIQYIWNQSLKKNYIGNIAIQAAYTAIYFRDIYRSMQGEVDQAGFWNLVLNNNKQVWKMLKQMGWKGDSKIREKGIFISSIQYWQEQKIDQQYISYIHKQYQFLDILQIKNICDNFDMFLKAGKYDVAQNIMKLKFDLCKNENNTAKELCEYAYNYSQLLYHLKQYQCAINQCQNVIQNVSQKQVQLVKLYSQNLKCYIELGNVEMVTNTAQLLRKLIQFNYGAGYFYINSITCIEAYFYKFLDIKKTIILFNKALQNSRHHKNKNQTAQILLDLAKIYYQQQNINLAIECCKKSLKETQKEGLTGVYLLMGIIKYQQYELADALQYLNKAQKLKSKLTKLQLFKYLQIKSLIYLKLQNQTEFHKNNEQMFALGLNQNQMEFKQKAVEILLVSQFSKWRYEQLQILKNQVESIVQNQQLVFELNHLPDISKIKQLTISLNQIPYITLALKKLL